MENKEKIVPQGFGGVPKQFKDDGVKTKVRRMDDVIDEKLQQIKDMATMEVLLPVDVRMKKRLETIRKMGGAQSFKIDRHWKTNPPQMHITGLEGRKLSMTEAEVRFGVFETDEKGNKKLYENYADVVLHDGSRIKRPTSAEYKVAYEVVEHINYKKPITREVNYVKDRGEQ